MKFTQKDYLGTKQILKFPDHAVSMAVMVSDAGVSLNEDNQKIVSAGTIVGGGGFIGKPVSNVHAGCTAASLTTAFTEPNSNLVFTACENGTDGNAIKIALVAPTTADQALNINVVGKVITVNLATDNTKAITTIANEVIEAIKETNAAKALVYAKPIQGSDGSGKVAALAETALSGGQLGSAGVAEGVAEGVLMNDVDVTYGANTGAMIIHGFIDVKKIPNKPSAADIAALKQIVFL